jgi:hypothetical protein
MGTVIFSETSISTRLDSATSQKSAAFSHMIIVTAHEEEKTWSEN